MPKVSVIIPSYNRGYIVCEAIESVLAQTFSDLEVIVADDGSTDDTAQKVASIGDSRVRYFRQDNAGVSAARNRGIAEARGEIIAFLDSDDLWKSEKLEANVSFLDRHHEADAVFSDAGNWPAFKEWILGRSFERELAVPARDLYLMLLQQVTIHTSALAVRASAVRDTGPFDLSTKCGEDWEWFLRLSRKHQFGYVDRPLVVLRSFGDEIHRKFPKQGNEFRFLRNERRKIPLLDRAARRASRAGILDEGRLGIWDAQTREQTCLAAATALRAFVMTRSPEMLMRAVWVCLPGRSAGRRSEWQPPSR